MLHKKTIRKGGAIVVATVVAFVAAAHVSAQHIYWVDNDTTVRMARTDGTFPTALHTAVLRSPSHVALDSVARKIYWSDRQKIRRSNLDGTGIEDVVTHSFIALGIALDIAGGKIYWVADGSVARYVFRASLAGTGIEELANVGTEYVNSIAVDPVAGKIYWQASENGSRIIRANLDGTNAEPIVDSQNYINSLAVDRVGRKLFWTTGYETCGVYRSEMDGSAAVRLLDRCPGTPNEIAVDASGNAIYWSESVDEGAVRLQRSNIDGSDVSTPIEELGFSGGLAVDEAIGQVFWADAALPAIHTAKVDGSMARSIVRSPFYDARDLEIDIIGGHLYWNQRNGRGLFRSAMDGTNIEADVGEVRSGHNLALDTAGRRMFLSTQFARIVSRINLESGVRSVSFTGSVYHGIAYDPVENKVYWTQTVSPRVARANPDGTQVQTIVSGVNAPQAEQIAIDSVGRKMYWTDLELHKVRRANLDGTGIEDLIPDIEDEVDPLAVFVDAYNRTLYWSDTRHGHLWQSELDGSNRTLFTEAGAVEGITVDPRGVGDFDLSLSVDLADFAAFQNCYQPAEELPVAPRCQFFDNDPVNRRVDAADFRDLRDRLTGPK